MLPRRKPSKFGLREDQRSYPRHLKFVRGFVCACFKSGACSGRIEAHHVREGASAGTGIKPPDYMAVPLCAVHHAEGHRIGWKTFEAKYAVNLLSEAEKIARVSPAKDEWEREE
jgi:hypothetical protein